MAQILERMVIASWSLYQITQRNLRWWFQSTIPMQLHFRNSKRCSQCCCLSSRPYLWICKTCAIPRSNKRGIQKVAQCHKNISSVAKQRAYVSAFGNTNNFSIGFFFDAGFATNKDFASPLGFIVMLMEKDLNANIICYESMKSKRGKKVFWQLNCFLWPIVLPCVLWFAGV